MPTPEQNPLAWARETWERTPLELLTPAAIGLVLAQAAIALFVLRSTDHALLWACFGAIAFAVGRTLAFVYQLHSDAREGVPTPLEPRDLLSLLVPSALAVALYALIAPNERFGIFFALATLPHFALLLYLIKHHAQLAAAPLTLQPNLLAPSVIALVAQRLRSVRGAAQSAVKVVAMRVRKSTEFSRS